MNKTSQGLFPHKWTCFPHTRGVTAAFITVTPRRGHSLESAPWSRCVRFLYYSRCVRQHQCLPDASFGSRHEYWQRCTTFRDFITWQMRSECRTTHCSYATHNQHISSFSLSWPNTWADITASAASLQSLGAWGCRKQRLPSVSPCITLQGPSEPLQLITELFANPNSVVVT